MSLSVLLRFKPTGRSVRSWCDFLFGKESFLPLCTLLTFFYTIFAGAAWGIAALTGNKFLLLFTSTVWSWGLYSYTVLFLVSVAIPSLILSVLQLSEFVRAARVRDLPLEIGGVYINQDSTHNPFVEPNVLVEVMEVKSGWVKIRVIRGFSLIKIDSTPLGGGNLHSVKECDFKGAFTPTGENALLDWGGDQ